MVTKVSQQIYQQNNETIQARTWDNFYVATSYGLVGNGTTNDSAALSTLINTTIDGDNATIIFPAGTYRIGSDLTIPDNVSLFLPQGAILSIDSGVTLTINGSISAGLYRIFSGSGTVNGDVQVTQIYPQWFGAKADGVTSDSTAIQKAITLASYNRKGNIVFCPASSKGYLITSTITVNQNVSLVGAGAYGAFKNTQDTTADECTTFYIGFSTSYAIIQAGSSSVNGIRFNYPNQTKTNPPVTYPATIALQGQDTYTGNCFFLNSFIIMQNTLDLARNLIENIYGNPLNRGIVITEAYDRVVIRNIHFWPYWYAIDPDFQNSPIYTYVRQNCIGLDLQRTDAILVDGVFCFGMNALAKITRRYTNPNANTSGYGIFTNLQSDYCLTSIICLDLNSFQGYTFTNVEFAVDSSTAADNRGFSINNCGETPILINGGRMWNINNMKAYIEANSGILLVQNVAFGTLPGTGDTGVLVYNNCALTIMNCYFAAAGGTAVHIDISGMSTSITTLITNCRFKTSFVFNSGGKPNTVTANTIL